MKKDLATTFKMGWNNMKKLLEKILFKITTKEKGATAVEYALIILLIVLAIVISVTAFGIGLNVAYQNIVNSVHNVTG